ncbi:sensor domain-containing diguanylate cyclase [Leptospira yasudae]|uniref:sensor domain-containing diguanylate cyclase n=1 Tax=Leptospira yasudae TaxID=2202201 RepID=UPI001090F6C7|nr:sensor domain-containing diguanylate cyclase [Leptospira yasudae]MBW0435790.1 GGDEF domain-containing protein [Leptospira yasudae]TGM95445.1 sensor domain-containing diguanylate cyclase [Leptospira yasudae]
MSYKKEYNLEKFYQYSLDLFSIQRLDGTVISVNPSFHRILGWTEEELLGNNPFHLLHPDDLDTIKKEFEKLDGGIPRSSIQNRIRCTDGSYKHFAWTGYPDLEAGLVYVTGRDITETIEANQKISQLASELKEANDRLFEQATTDPLTKLKNRRAFTEELQYLMRYAQNHKSQLSLLMIDVDHFKEYNDKFGHPAGDAILVNLAKLLMETLSKNAAVARYGGEEFIVALPDTSRALAIEVAEKLTSAVREFNWENRKVTISIGASTTGSMLNEINNTFDTKELLENADRALYASKANGRNRVTHSHSES